jgi:hypothetical protein
MRWVFVALLAGVLAFSGSGAAAAKDKVPCKKIKELITAGKTPDEVARELNTRVQRVEQCMSGKKKKEAAAAATGAGSADEDAED